MIREHQGKRKLFKKVRANQGNFRCYVVLFQSNDLVHTQSHFQLNVTIAKVDPFVYPYYAQFCAVFIKYSSMFYETEQLNDTNRANAPPSTISVQKVVKW